MISVLGYSAIENYYYSLLNEYYFFNDKMIEYLLSMGANPYLKTTDGQDAFDLSLRYQTIHR